MNYCNNIFIIRIFCWIVLGASATSLYSAACKDRSAGLSSVAPKNNMSVVSHASLSTYAQLAECLVPYPRLKKVFHALHSVPSSVNRFVYLQNVAVFEELQQKYQLPHEVVFAFQRFNKRMMPRRKKPWWKKTEVVIPAVASATIAGLAAWYWYSQRHAKLTEGVSGLSRVPEPLCVVSTSSQFTAPHGAVDVLSRVTPHGEVGPSLAPPEGDAVLPQSGAAQPSSPPAEVGGILDIQNIVESGEVSSLAKPENVALLKKVLCKSISFEMSHCLQTMPLASIIVCYKDANKVTANEIITRENKTMPSRSLMVLNPQPTRLPNDDPLVQLIIDRYLVMGACITVMLQTPQGRTDVQESLITDDFIHGNIYPILKLSQYQYIMEHGLRIALDPVMKAGIQAARSNIPVAVSTVIAYIRQDLVNKIAEAARSVE
jgi:hypothetical protein